MASNPLQPIVLHPIELAPFIQYLLANHSTPTTLIVCSTQDVFLQQLQASIAHEKDHEAQQATAEGLDPIRVARIASRRHELLIPTIHQLASSRTVKVVFCATLAQLQAYLGVYEMSEVTEAGDRNADEIRKGSPTFALLNPVQLHRDTSSFSAQGLSRIFASAVEAAARSKQKLLIVECPSRVPDDASRGPEASPSGVNEEEETHRPNETGDEVDPWEQQVAILNVTTKSFGAGERGWVGRTVQAKRIVGRWCVFQRVEV